MKLVTIFLALSVTLSISDEPLPCGTVPTQETLDYYNSKLSALKLTQTPPTNRDEWIYIVTKNHVFKNSKGDLAISEVELQEQMNMTNQFYAANKMKFLAMHTNVITSDTYYNYVKTGTSDNDLYNTYGDTNAINIFWAKTGIFVISSMY